MEKDFKASCGLNCNRCALTLLLHKEVSSVGGHGGVNLRTYRSHDMGRVADNDYFAVHIPRERVSDQERIRKDPFFRGPPIKKSVERVYRNDVQDGLQDCLDARMEISRHLQKIGSRGSGASIFSG